MTSRMAWSYRGRFRSLAIESGSYFYCAGPLCDKPAGGIPADHPPTLFLHGDLDPIVPAYTETKYHKALAGAGVETKMVTQPDAWHQWIKAAPVEIPAWFRRFAGKPPAPPAPPLPATPPPAAEQYLCSAQQRCVAAAGGADIETCRAACSAAPVPPPPAGCPGGSLTGCIDLCPGSDAAFKACAASCAERCA